MPEITIDRSVPSPQAAVAPRLRTVLDGYAAREDMVLEVEIGLAGAAMSVPVVIDLDGPRTATAFSLTLRARQQAAWFPAFRGEVRSEPVGPLESTLRLQGTYELPLGPLGDIADRTILGHAAERSLQHFADRLRTDVVEEIRRAELSVRQREGHHS